MVSPKRLHEAAFMYVGLGVAAGGFHTAGSATTHCFDQIVSASIHWGFTPEVKCEAKTERATDRRL